MNAQKTIENLQAELAELRQKRTKLGQERQELQATITKLEAEGTSRKLEGGKIGDLLDRIERVYTEKRILEGADVSLQSQIAAKEAEIVGARQELGRAEVAKIEKEMSTLFDDIEKRLVELKGAMENLSIKRRALNDLASEYKVASRWQNVSFRVDWLEAYLAQSKEKRRAVGS